MTQLTQIFIFSDKELAESQLSKKHQNNLSNSISKDMTEKYSPGDFIAVNNEKNKHNISDVYYVDQVFNDKLQVNKILRFHSTNSKLQTKNRIVHKNDVFVDLKLVIKYLINIINITDVMLTFLIVYCNKITRTIFFSHVLTDGV